MEIAKTTKTTIESLKNSPIFAMSLSSKELFHSNFWAWLMDQDSEFIECFFPSDDLSGENGIQILREKEHMDIQIVVGVDKYVIENKFKSIPTESQLLEYAGAEGFKKGVLTGISKEPPFKLPEKWKYLSYDCICTRLENQLDNTKNDNLKENKDIVTQYIEMTRNLVGLVGDFLNEYGNKWLFPDKIPKEIKDLRIGDVIQKMQTENFLHFFREKSRYKEDFFVKKDGYTLIARTDMSHATSLFEVYMEPLKVNGIPEDSKRIGIQIQDGQFRWFVAANKSVGPETVFRDIRYIKWFDTEFKAGERISVPGQEHKKPTKLGGKGNCYCKFISKSSQFIHQYFTPSEEELMFDKLTKLIDSFLGAASTII